MIIDTEYIKKQILVDIDKEIYSLEELIDIITDTKSVVDFSVDSTDVRVMKSRLSAFKDAKGMIQKLSIDVDGFDNVSIMTDGEKRLYYGLIRTILFFRRLFRMNKK